MEATLRAARRGRVHGEVPLAPHWFFLVGVGWGSACSRVTVSLLYSGRFAAVSLGFGPCSTPPPAPPPHQIPNSLCQWQTRSVQRQGMLGETSAATRKTRLCWLVNIDFGGFLPTMLLRDGLLTFMLLPQMTVEVLEQPAEANHDDGAVLEEKDEDKATKEMRRRWQASEARVRELEAETAGLRRRLSMVESGSGSGSGGSGSSGGDGE